MRVIICKVGEEPVIKDIDEGFESMQDVVDGRIECVSLSDDIDLWCNEEFLYNGSKPNRLISTSYGDIISINGTFFISSNNEDGETIGLSNKQVDEWMEKVNDFPISITSMI